MLKPHDEKDDLIDQLQKEIKELAVQRDGLLEQRDERDESIAKLAQEFHDLSKVKEELVVAQAAVRVLEERYHARRNLCHVDATPNKGYAVRILRAHRQSHEGGFTESMLGLPPENELYKKLNETNAERLSLLDQAIAKLEMGTVTEG